MPAEADDVASVVNDICDPDSADRFDCDVGIAEVDDRIADLAAGFAGDRTFAGLMAAESDLEVSVRELLFPLTEVEALARVEAAFLTAGLSAVHDR
jgi:hypothetical protein